MIEIVIIVFLEKNSSSSKNDNYLKNIDNNYNNNVHKYKSSKNVN